MVHWPKTVGGNALALLLTVVVVALGLGLALLVTVIAIDGNLRRQFLAALPDKAPAFYFVDIPAADAGKFDTFVRAHAPRATLDRVPMLRGRIVAANGVPAITASAPQATARSMSPPVVMPPSAMTWQ